MVVPAAKRDAVAHLRNVLQKSTPILVEARVNGSTSSMINSPGAVASSILNIVDDVTRECLAAIPGTSISGKPVAREPTLLVEARGKPRMIVSDNGTEFTSNAILSWTKVTRWTGTWTTDAERLHRVLQRPDA